MSNSRDSLFVLIEKEYEENYLYLKNFILKLTKDDQIAEDLIQETFLKVLKNPEQVVTVTYFRSWLITCAKNLFIDFKRKKNPTLFQDENVMVKLIGNTDNPEITFLMRESIKQALQGFSELDRSIFIAKEYYGYKFDEIAQLLDVPVNTVKSKLFRLKKTVLKDNTRRD
ncbi:RNA polymerase sigma-70 factor, ECF subfamily [Oceanobacillus limi]|uniref:RNA polymerase sigma-70 factor, ECF subfamily n=1 Tax=Oceanobacillus limi TaxID=930131 RepID=A0A1I0C588_9BACI|nr:RNA polymerase sigma factor [Oceanobacillus limi]SET14631.1 RNA polymerase sigma-70 factor, ECF subfamily [Oceanobacillus limi]